MWQLVEDYSAVSAGCDFYHQKTVPQSMDTAPKSGEFLAWWPDAHAGEGAWIATYRSGCKWFASIGGFAFEPTLWLPKPPKPTE